jgi:hypothetical protein
MSQITTTRDEFRSYVLDLRDACEAEGEGQTVDVDAEWRWFVDSKIELGELAEEAREWKR